MNAYLSVGPSTHTSLHTIRDTQLVVHLRTHSTIQKCTFIHIENILENVDTCFAHINLCDPSLTAFQPEDRQTAEESPTAPAGKNTSKNEKRTEISKGAKGSQTANAKQASSTDARPLPGDQPASSANSNVSESISI